MAKRSIKERVSRLLADRTATQQAIAIMRLMSRLKKPQEKREVIICLIQIVGEHAYQIGFQRGEVAMAARSAEMRQNIDSITRSMTESAKVAEQMTLINTVQALSPLLRDAPPEMSLPLLLGGAPLLKRKK